VVGLFNAGAFAQSTYPTQAIKIIVPFTPGTGMDTIARVVAPRLSERLGQPVVVQNQPGASGNIGADTVAKSNPDGHTILMGANTMLMAAQMYKNVSQRFCTSVHGSLWRFDVGSQSQNRHQVAV
jgi:tripartite-type tricarboxylate transporter receptor subunit TctC